MITVNRAHILLQSASKTVKPYCQMSLYTVVYHHTLDTMFAPTINRVIKQMKGYITKQIGYSIWQKSFNDHIVRNNNDYKEIWEYIENNPLKKS